MRLEHYPPEKLKREIRKIIRRHLGSSEYRVFFFGSRVANKGSTRSDIDIGLEGKKPIPAHALAAIREEIENLPTLYTIDVVDFRTVTPDFRAVALKQTEAIL